MERLFFECTVRAALLVGGTAIVLYAMRVKAAAARHAVWTGVVALMLVLPIWTAWGPQVSLRLLPPLARRTIDEAIVPLPVSTAALPSHSIPISQAVLFGAYLLGLGLLLARLGMGTARARRLIRGAVLRDGMPTSSLCVAPVTVGFLYPTVILPEQWRQWPPAQLDAVLTHEREHSRRRDALVQWLALLNRALFWFHPAAWWLERHLSALAEEACDNAVLERGHNPGDYCEYLIDMARSVTRAATRIKATGMAMPGSSLPHRIRRILEGGPVPHISRARMACVGVVCAITCTAFAAGTLDHAQGTSLQSESANKATKFVLGDLKIEGDVHDRDGIRSRVLQAWKDREYDDGKKLANEVAENGIRGDFQRRGYFRVFVHDPVVQPLRLIDGKQHILLITPVTEGDQFRLGTLTFQNVAPDRALSIPVATLRDQFHLRDGDLFSVPEIRAGIERLKALYSARGYADATLEPAAHVDDTAHRVNFILSIDEGSLTP